MTSYQFLFDRGGFVMNKHELIESILKNKEVNDITKKQLNNIVNTTLDVIKKSVKKGEDVSLLGFGTFTKIRRKARMGVNPSTGEPIKIKAKNVVKFRPGKAFNEML